MDDTKEKYMNTAEEIIKYLTDLAKTGEYVFRGYSIQEQMQPNLTRNKVQDIELELLSEFEKYGIQYCISNNSIDFLANAQHYGLSTRLLDFTYNPFVALYFALYKQKGGNYKVDEDKEYYYIRYAKITEQIVFKQLPKSFYIRPSETNTLTREYGDALRTLGGFLDNIEDKMVQENILEGLNKTNLQNDFEVGHLSDMVRGYIQNSYFDYNPDMGKKDKDDQENYIKKNLKSFIHKRLLFLDTNQSNQRIVMQQGLFLFPYVLDIELYDQMVRKNTFVIKISKNTRKELQDYLNTLGMNAYRLMPDLSSICEAAERNVKERRSRINPPHFGR